MSVYYYIGLPQPTTDADRDTEVKTVPTFGPFVVDERALPAPTAPQASIKSAAEAACCSARHSPMPKDNGMPMPRE